MAFGHKSLSVSHSLNSKGQVQIAANQGREGIQRQARSSQESIVLGQRPGSPSKNTHNIMLSSSAELSESESHSVLYDSVTLWTIA